MKLIEKEPVERILDRLKALDREDVCALDTQAVLGTIEPPKDTIRDAFKLYCDKLSIGETARKATEQIGRWKAAKARAVDHFVALCSKLTMEAIERRHGRQFYDWWGERLRLDVSGQCIADWGRVWLVHAIDSTYLPAVAPLHADCVDDDRRG